MLTVKEIEHAPPGMHADGNGLYLQVTKSGNKSWILRYQLAGKRREMGLGALKDVPVRTARQIALEEKVKLVAGIDPIEQRIRDRNEAAAAEAAEQAKSVTFAVAATKYIEGNRAGWRNAKHAQQWENTLTTYAFPTIGDKPVGDVVTEHVLEILKPIWQTKTETASRVRSRIELILDYAKVHGWRQGENPARWRGHLSALLPKPNRVKREQHHPALPWEQIAEFMKEVRSVPGFGARALELAILTACRSGEVRQARWQEFDLQQRTWTIPAVRMKAKREHRIPLSQEAALLLSGLPRLDGTDHVFPGEREGKPISDMTMTLAIRRINKKRINSGQAPWVDRTSGDPVVPHGFRSTFRDWASEATDHSHEMAEIALAHTIGSKVEAAYRRGDMFERRRQLMQDWSNRCGIALEPNE